MSGDMDERFSHIAKDPRFRQMRKAEKKVKIDKRFKGMFTDKQFKLKYTIDKRGRPTDTSTNENLRRFYDLSDSEDDVDEDQNIKENRDNLDEEKISSSSDENINEDIKQKSRQKLKNKPIKSKTKSKLSTDKRKKTKAKIKNRSSADNSDTSHDEDGQASGEEGIEKGPDLARGEGNMESSSDEDDEEDVKEGKSDDTEGSFEHKWGEFDKDVPEAEELGRRLAVCNMDWDRIKAVDIFVLLSSFIPPGGAIHNVKIYPSEYGQQRMEEEKVKGPQELVDTPGVRIISNNVDDNVDENDEDDIAEDMEGSKYHREKLRQYQLNRLRYYYAVVECDSIATASHIYNECDGIEYESSSTKVDLRFIPDSMTFDQEPKSVCEETPSGSMYKPSTFLTSALSQSKVNLTWDETDHDRLKVTMRAPDLKGEVNEEDFKAYLASSSDEEEDPYRNVVNGSDSGEGEISDEENHIEKYKMLLQNIKESEKKRENKNIEMEVTWEPGLKETTEKVLKRKEQTKNITPWEEYLMKKKEKRKKKKEERKTVDPGSSETSDKRKEKSKQAEDSAEDQDDVAFSDDELPADIDLTDPYFAEELTKGEQTSVGRNTKSCKKKKKKEEKLTEEEQAEKEKREAELALLMEDEEEDGRKHFSLKKLVEENQPKKKKKKFAKEDKPKKEDDFQIDIADKRFEAMYSSHLYNVDPTAPEYKNTKGMEALVEEKIRRRQSQSIPADPQASSSNSSHKRKQTTKEEVVQLDHKVRRMADREQSQGDSIASLVQSIKTKTRKFHSKTKR